MGTNESKPPTPPVYTRTGDQGQTSLRGGARVAKDHPRVELLGTLDELLAHLGAAASRTEPGWLRGRIEELQEIVFVACGELACPDEEARAGLDRALTGRDVARLEAIVDEVRSRTPVAPGFLFPVRDVAVALNLARTVARRAERRLCTVLHDEEAFNPSVPAAINRLSDTLFALTWFAEAKGESPNR